mmetsp:Transcript_44531/g.93435  ORF Transcript_44531/g.93435 Transcript_44531/m.93435 type:complete len:223 (+) Transcript_44531:167-835(+)|eukprot:CAMPEP_0183736710 /NCGR_PEP_ID=MMETSP0737-20130205/50042_1 /TAXON_ID=385413 /ORGANISM="Thalassiosira miniscula, Strain CCMP1093" /LENGTH=222 /DNA_ID=CAMNT_0025970785 /DNA_START=159 /DNA_END=827 /DNA_ORIENTATION=+
MNKDTSVRQEQTYTSPIVVGVDVDGEDSLQETAAPAALTGRHKPVPSNCGDGSDDDDDTSLESALFDMIIIGPEDRTALMEPLFMFIEVPLVPPPIEPLESGFEFEPENIIPLSPRTAVSISSKSSSRKTPKAPAIGASHQGAATDTVRIMARPSINDAVTPLAAVSHKAKKRKVTDVSTIQRPSKRVANKDGEGNSRPTAQRTKTACSHEDCANQPVRGDG